MEAKKVLKAISKHVLIMNKTYDELMETKRDLLNHPITMEYLFNKPIHNDDDLESAIGSCKDYYIKKIKLDKSDMSEIEGLMMAVYKKTEEYIIDYEAYKNYMKEYQRLTNKKINLDKQIIYHPRMVPELLKIDKILQNITEDYTREWTFEYEEEYVNANRAIPYNFNTKLKVDFYGYVKDKKNRLIQYAITYNDSEKITMSDYLRQYYLCQLGIHHLRLRKKSDIKKEIKKFMRVIKESDEHVAMNSLDIRKIKEIKSEPKVLAAINIFIEDYNYNRRIYMKYYYGKREEESMDSDDKIHNYKEDGDDEQYGAEDVDDIINSKYMFTR